ncbi:MAG TPA: nucleotidyltransferase [Verrucomicrobiae bacterium]|jgi:predicted nucleotidyltransferase|nr:nucleotidyltransferase [Verrucomicrobiae bacterium]
MAGNPHFRELLQKLSAHGVEFLIVGGYAVVNYAEPRFTKDLDIWIRNTGDNAKRVYAALAEFGAPLKTDKLTPQDFTSEDITYQIGLSPLRVDIMTRIDGVLFDEAWTRRVEGIVAGVEAHFISLEDLIRNKEASGRTSDAEHLKHLRKRSI